MDVAQDVITRDLDCGTEEGTWITRAETAEVAGSEPGSFAKRLVGRLAAAPVTHPGTGEVIAERNVEVLDEAIAQRVDDGGVDGVLVRSPLTCASRYGVCRTATAATSPPGAWSRPAKPSVSSPPSRSASPAPS